MAFRVEITEEAERDAQGILDWLISEQAGETGLRWFKRLEEAITSLATFPRRCPVVPENLEFDSNRRASTLVGSQLEHPPDRARRTSRREVYSLSDWYG
jgi:plasmid stabilization system protein ParE